MDTLRRTYQQPMLLIEGFIDWKDPVLSGTLCTILLFWKYQVIFTLGKAETALAVGHLFTKFGVGKSGRLPPCAVKKRRTVGDIMLEMLQIFEGVGPVTAKRILEVITHEKFVKLSAFELSEELTHVKGLSNNARHLLVTVFKGREEVD